MAQDGIGVSVRRKEDFRFLTGRGNYVDDINRPGQTYAYILRSPHANAAIRKIDIAKAKSAQGVIAVFTGADMAKDNIGGLPCGWLVKSKDGSPMKEPPHPPLVVDRVRHVGDHVAIVIADTKDHAKDAAEQIEVDYKVDPAVVSVSDAIKPGAPKVWPDAAPDNVCYDWHIGDKAQTDAAFSKAAHVVKFDLVNNRLIPNAMEPRAAIGDFDRGTGEYTLYTTSQNPHVIRLLMGAFVLHIPESKLRVVAPDVGGGFGSKIFHYAEEAILTWAAGKIGKPIKWVAERSESFMSDAHGRDHVSHAELALDKDGKFLALRVSTLANMGAYLSTFASCVPTYLYATLLAGVYTTPVIYCEVKAVFTNTVPVDAYRGAGRPEATFLLERLVDVAARQMKMDRVEIRRKNFIPANAFPYQTPVALQYDSGDYQATLEQCLKTADWAGFPARKAEAQKRGKLRGIGISTYLEACGIESVEISHGDTNKIPFGMGTYGSRSLAVGGTAIVKAMDKIVAKSKKIAAHLLEAAEADIEFKDGKFTVAGTDKSKSFGEIALTAYVPHNYPLDVLEPGLDETAFYDPKNFTFPGGCHICEVEVDPDTGVTKIVNFTAVDDVGRVINPMIVEGQVQGGVVQGIGQALLETCVYDQKSGQLLTGSLMDYTMPRADDVPSISVGTNTTLCTHNPLGVKGCGEVGAIGSPPAVINAIVDALSHLGVNHIEMPATAQKVWQTIQSASPQKAA
jgi:carbon-monoxide dehydrogenase large subunit